MDFCDQGETDGGVMLKSDCLPYYIQWWYYFKFGKAAQKCKDHCSSGLGRTPVVIAAGLPTLSCFFFFKRKVHSEVVKGRREGVGRLRLVKHRCQLIVHPQCVACSAKTQGIFFCSREIPPITAGLQSEA